MSLCLIACNIYITIWPVGHSYGFDASKRSHMYILSFYLLKPTLPWSVKGPGKGWICRRWLWGRQNLSPSLSHKEEALLCSHPTTRGKPVRLPLLHHASANSMLITFLVRKFRPPLFPIWIEMWFLYISRWSLRKAAALSTYLSPRWLSLDQLASPDVLAWLSASWASTLR